MALTGWACELTRRHIAAMWKRNKYSAPMPISPEPGEHAEAKMPSGFVSRIFGDYGPDDGVPREAIVGAWKVDGDGNIFGEFSRNPIYDPFRPAANKVWRRRPSRSVRALAKLIAEIVTGEAEDAETSATVWRTQSWHGGPLRGQAPGSPAMPSRSATSRKRRSRVHSLASGVSIVAARRCASMKPKPRL
ncbi:hypothetical protein ACVWZA_002119 [Sphingomonas sp. UYAg733]